MFAPGWFICLFVCLFGVFFVCFHFVRLLVFCLLARLYFSFVEQNQMKSVQGSGNTVTAPQLLHAYCLALHLQECRAVRIPALTSLVPASQPVGQSVSQSVSQSPNSMHQSHMYPPSFPLRILTKPVIPITVWPLHAANMYDVMQYIR